MTTLEDKLVRLYNRLDAEFGGDDALNKLSEVKHIRDVCGEESARKFEEAFADTRLKVNAERFDANHEIIFCLSTEGFSYYLPALLKVTLSGEIWIDTFLLKLAGPGDGVLLRTLEVLRGYPPDKSLRLVGLSPSQLAATLSCLQFMRDNAMHYQLGDHLLLDRAISTVENLAR